MSESDSLQYLWVDLALEQADCFQISNIREAEYILHHENYWNDHIKIIVNHVTQKSQGIFIRKTLVDLFVLCTYVFYRVSHIVSRPDTSWEQNNACYFRRISRDDVYV